MRFSTRTLSVLISLVLSVGMVTGAFLLSSSAGPSVADAESTEELLRAYAAQDTDGDLLMDWQEELYGADPENTHSLDPQMTDREAVDSGKVKPKFASDPSALQGNTDTSLEGVPGSDPASGSLTERFAREFFEDYLISQTAGTLPSEEDLTLFVDGAIEEVVRENSARQEYTSASISVVDTSPETLAVYMESAEKAFGAHAAGAEKSDIEYFADAVYGVDENALTEVKRASEAYSGTAADLVKVPVPKEVATAHLRVANALSKMGSLTADMAEFDTDPLLGLVGLGAYEETVIELSSSFAALYPVLEKHGVVLTSSEGGYYLYLSIEAAHARKLDGLTP